MGTGEGSLATARLTRLLRGYWPDRNPVRRSSDRLEAAVLTVLVIAFLAAAPFVAQAASGAAQAAGRQAQLAQEASSHQVPALVLTDASLPRSSADTAPAPEAQIRWTATDGRPLTGEMPVPAATRAGATVLAWVSDSGQLADPPLTELQVAGQASLAGTGSVAVLGIVIIAAAMAARWTLSRRRMAAWDTEWRSVGPRWTTRT